MRKTTFVLKIALALAVLSLVIVPMVWAQTPGPSEQFFNQTGHGVRDPFLSFYLNTGGPTQYGYPITDSYVDPNTGILVQYFQKARLEWWPGNADPYKIQLGLLGDDLGKRQPGLPVSAIPSPSDPGCHYYPETGQAVCFRFLEYFAATGDIFQYGYPVSGITLENGRMVQYFQRARMEWWPEKPPGHTIQLAELGQIYYDYAKLDRTRLQPRILSANPGAVTGLTAYASVTNAIIAQGGSQVVYVRVQDQLNKRLAGAAVTMVAEFPNGPVAYTLPPTDANGLTTFTFAAGNHMPGTTVPLRFIVDYAGLSTETRTSYLLWFV